MANNVVSSEVSQERLTAEASKGTRTNETPSRKSDPKLTGDIHAFYYPWYGNPEFDGEWLHWNHEFLPHWDPARDRKYPKGRHNPPNDIGANFYPKLGPYSSRSPGVMDAHMQQMRDAGIGVVAVSWYPPNQADSQGKPWDMLIPPLLDAAVKYNLRIALHVEPFAGRSAETLHAAIKYAITAYGNHPGLYRRSRRGKKLPVFYFYDSYQVTNAEWVKLFSAKGEYSLRSTQFDCVAIGLAVNLQHVDSLVRSKFDGVYTYFASNGFSYGSTWSNWNMLSSRVRKHGLIFVPSVGPGYVDTRVRLWNDENTKNRDDGKYYETAWKYAAKANPDIISITSFNEWHEGTQIEAAVPKADGNFTYCDYAPNSPNFYLELTKRFVDTWLESRVK